MDTEEIITLIVVGAIAGWLASLFMRGRGLGLVGTVIIGVMGAALGGWIFRTLDISVRGDWVGVLITATSGSVVLLFILGLIRKKR